MKSIMGLLLYGVLLASTHVNAHESRPLFVQISEVVAGQFRLSWTIPASIPASGLPRVQMPSGCSPLQPGPAEAQHRAYTGASFYSCPEGLAGQQLVVDYPGANPSVATLFQLRLLSGEQHSKVLGPEQYVWTVPDREERLGVMVEYLSMGIAHIWKGIDHLLFVACLVFIAARPKAILITLTGFTLAHSLTLILSTLQWVRLPVPPVEAVIALSILFLAQEIAIGRSNSLTYRHPLVVSSCFGLLHGFGFAAVLSDIGLPQTQLPAALLAFNVGVEIGQIAFVLLLAVLLGLLRAWQGRGARPWRLQRFCSYVIGSIAGFWFIERIVAF